MDNSSSSNNNTGRSSGGANRPGGSNGQGGGIADRAATKAISAESDVKKDMGAAVSNTYVAETMTVTNNYNF